jgi:hypothetical protein
MVGVGGQGVKPPVTAYSKLALKLMALKLS